MAERLYSTYQVADLLGATPGQVIEWMQKGWLGFQRLPNGPVRITEKHLVHFLRQQGIDIEAVMAKAILRQEQYKAAERQEQQKRQQEMENSTRKLLGPAAPPPPADAPSQYQTEDAPACIQEPPEGPQPPPSSAPDAPEPQASPTPLASASGGDRPVEPADLARQIIDAILRDAVKRHASAIHLEERPEGLSLRMRIDGVLHEKPNFRNRLPATVTPILADTFETLAALPPSAGESLRRCRFQWTFDGRSLDFELLSLPGAQGRRLSCRLLGAEPPALTLPDMLSSDDMGSLRRILAHQSGLVLVAGGPRSGVRELLEALRAELEHAPRQILTAGRCAEAAGEPAAQITRALRSADADVLILEELEDADAIHAALDAADNGCLVLAGLRAVHNAEAVSMLREARPDAWRLAANLRAILSIRLARKLCDECKQPIAPGHDFLARLNLQHLSVPDKAFAPAGCSRCGNTGTLGWSAIVSALTVTPDVASLLRRCAPADQVTAHCAALYDAALAKVAAGILSLEELARVLPV